MAKKLPITQKELKELFKYEPETGNFIRLTNTCRNIIGSIAGYKSKNNYINISINNKTYLAHRLAWLYVYGEFPNTDIDHENGIRNDNRIGNLRKASRIQNGQNRKLPKNNKSGCKGVGWNKQKKRWRVIVALNTIDQFLGYYLNYDDAVKVYNDFTKLYFGKFYKELN